jgi:hypothetical protein
VPGGYAEAPRFPGRSYVDGDATSAGFIRAPPVESTKRVRQGFEDARKEESTTPGSVDTAVCRTRRTHPLLDRNHSSGEATPWWNLFVHALGAIAVLVLLTVPLLESWVDGHVMAGK